MNHPKILIAEDDPLEGERQRQDLVDGGYRVIDVVDSADALVACVRVQPVDLLVIDIVLKGDRDGIAAAEEVLEFASVPVIFVTAYHSEEFLSRAESVHPAAYILKPYNRRELLFQTRMALIRHANEQRLLTAKQDAETALWHLATHDMLTQLPNRKLLMDRLHQQVSSACRHDQHFALLFIDLNDFKRINDGFGHGIGDQVLQRFATRLRGAMRENDTVARLGGDEFVLLVELEQEHPQESAIAITEKLRDRVCQPLQTGPLEITPQFTCGIAIYPMDSQQPDELLSHADAAMYEAKNKANEFFAFYSPALTDKAMEFVQLEQALKTALQHDQFELHYQPQISVSDGTLMGVEALIRWQRPGHGYFAPDAFIPIAEETGLIAPLTEWVCREACRQMRLWLDLGLPIPSIAINVSNACTINRALQERLIEVIEASACPMRHVELEITESHVIHDMRNAGSWLTSLSERGFQIAIDDFGTGYSSLSYLKQLPVQKLKIDRSFVRDLTEDPNDRAICHAIIGMSQSLGMVTVAEGVETVEQLNFLRQHGCELMQGYLSSPAVAAEVITERLKNHGASAFAASP